MPMIVAYINGRINLYIEFLKNGKNIKAHFHQFESQIGAYKALNENYILLDFELENPYPRSIPQYCKQYGNKYYCFVISTHLLYHDGKLISKNVSNRLTSSGHQVQHIL